MQRTKILSLLIIFILNVLVVSSTNLEFSDNAKWIGAIRLENSHLPVGRHDFHAPSLKKPEIRAIYDSINPLALRSILLRKTFSINKKIEKAEIRISGLGSYVLTVNGKRISNDLFSPAWSNYDKTVYYNTYQLESFLSEGRNSLGVLLGNGFYNAVGNRYRKLWVTYGPPTLLLDLQITFADASTMHIVSDKTWKYAESPITFNDIFGGEDYDARLEQKDWDKADFDDSAWKPVFVQRSPKGELRSQLLTAVRSMEQFGVKSVERIDSSFVFDMGQNLAGYPAIKVRGKRGQIIRLTVGEQLDAQGKVSQKQSGAPHYYSYILRGDGVEEWHPEFSYYGFRYIQVDGIDSLPQLLDIKSHFIYNSTENIGRFECSNSLLNKTHALIQNALKSNMQTVFTDCPHREKLGWLEQTHLNCGAILYNWDMRQFYPKIMRDIADSQLENGMIPTTAPEYVIFEGQWLDVFRDSPEWSIASVMLPYLYYQFYGDKSLINSYFDVMTRFVDYLGTKAENHILNIGLGDWYDYDGGKGGFSKNSPVEVSATAHYFYAAQLLADMSKLIGNKKDSRKYATLANRIRNAFNQKYFDKNSGQYSNGSQFCNAVAIFMNIVEPKYKQVVLDNLKMDIEKHGNRLTTGDVGNRYLFMTLAMNGENELLYKMINHDEVPGYGFQLKFGATTLTEQWDPRQGASWNHFMMGQIDEWFFNSLAGIKAVSPGFKSFIIEPKVVGDLTFVKAAHKTIHGDIVVDWIREGNTFKLKLIVPENTDAKVVLPNGDKKKAASGEYLFECRM